MDVLFEKINAFEDRNNISILVQFCGDKSGHVIEFWDDDLIFQFDNIEDLYDGLDNIKLRKHSDGRTIKPTEIIEEYEEPKS